MLINELVNVDRRCAHQDFKAEGCGWQLSYRTVCIIYIYILIPDWNQIGVGWKLKAGWSGSLGSALPRFLEKTPEVAWAGRISKHAAITVGWSCREARVDEDKPPWRGGLSENGIAKDENAYVVIVMSQSMSINVDQCQSMSINDNQCQSSYVSIFSIYF